MEQYSPESRHAIPGTKSFWGWVILTVFLYYFPYRYLVLSWMVPALSHTKLAGHPGGGFYILMSARLSLYIYCIGITAWFMRRMQITVDEVGFGKLSGIFRMNIPFSFLIGTVWWLVLELSKAAANYLATSLGSIPRIVLAVKEVFLYPLAYDALKYLTIGPLTEELFFRGFLLTYISRYRGLRESILLTSFLFAVSHYDIGDVVKSQMLWTSTKTATDFVPLFISGIIYGLLYKRYRSIWAPLAAHIGFNLMGILFQAQVWFIWPVH